MIGKYVSFIKVAQVEEDMSQWILEEWLKAGFRELEWQYGYEEWKDKNKWKTQGEKCPDCFALDGQRLKIQDVLDESEKAGYNAPKYSMTHVGCKCRMKRIAREDERLDYPKEPEVTAPAEQTIEDKLKGINYPVEHIEEAIRDLFKRQGVETSESEIQGIKDEVLEYAKGLSMSNKSVATDQLWDKIRKLVLAITKGKKASVNVFGFIRIAKQVRKEFEEKYI